MTADELFFFEGKPEALGLYEALTDPERQIIADGCLINYYRNNETFPFPMGAGFTACPRGNCSHAFF